MNKEIRPTDTVDLFTRLGDETTSQVALVIGVSNLIPENPPFLDVVTVNPNALSYAGSSDWHLALTRHNGVKHVSDGDFHEGKVTIGYGVREPMLNEESPVEDPDLLEAIKLAYDRKEGIVKAELGGARDVPTEAEMAGKPQFPIEGEQPAVQKEATEEQTEGQENSTEENNK
jgi:hypothetical protein